MASERPTIERPTIKDIARVAGVSVATVSRALRGLPYVAAATRARIVKIAADLRYEAHPQAAGLASGRTWTIGLVAPQFGTWFPSRALGGINSVLGASGYDLLVSLMVTPEDRRRFLSEAGSFCRRVDGLILIDTFVSHEASHADSYFDRPVVAVGERLEGASSIAIDNRLAARRAVEHLIESGHERIGLIAGPRRTDVPTPVPEQRLLGYEDAIGAAGLTPDPGLVIDADWTAAGGAAALAALVDRRAPTAVFCMSDEMAFGAVRAATRLGLTVPGDLSVIGFDDHDLSEALGLTTMRQSVDDMGVRAAATVLGLIDGAEPTSEITWDVPLMARETTAAALDRNG